MEGFESSSEDNEAIMDIVTKSNVVHPQHSNQGAKANAGFRSRHGMPGGHQLGNAAFADGGNSAGMGAGPGGGGRGVHGKFARQFGKFRNITNNKPGGSIGAPGPSSHNPDKIMKGKLNAMRRSG